jgi:excisionase family DNA binding protein
MKAKVDIQPKLLTAAQTATYLSISERKLWNLTNENAIPCIRIGRSVRYSVSDLDLWIESQRIIAKQSD